MSKKYVVMPNTYIDDRLNWSGTDVFFEGKFENYELESIYIVSANSPEQAKEKYAKQYYKDYVSKWDMLYKGIDLLRGFPLCMSDEELEKKYGKEDTKIFNEFYNKYTYEVCENMLLNNIENTDLFKLWADNAELLNKLSKITFDKIIIDQIFFDSSVIPIINKEIE